MFSRESLRRSLSSGGGLVIAAIMTLAVGLGPNVAVFSLFDRLFLRPLPFFEPERLVQIHLFVNKDPRLPQAFLPLVYAETLAMRTDIFSGVAYANGATRIETRPFPGENPLMLSALTPNALEVLGVRPTLGRGFVEEDMASGLEQAVMLTHDTWQERFLSSPDVLALSWTAGRVWYHVVGVLPEGFLLPSSRLMTRVDGVVPFRGGRFGTGELITAPFARLRRGVSIPQAQAAVRASLTMVPWEAGAEAPVTDPSERLSVQPLQSGISLLVRPYLWLLFGGVWAVFTVACVNLAVLLYTWQCTREHETGIRLALGARPGHLARSVLLEAAVICATGAFIAWLAYSLTQDQLVAVVPAELRGFAVAPNDSRVVYSTIAAAVIAALAVSVAPTRAALTVDLLKTLYPHRRLQPHGRFTTPFLFLAAEGTLAFVVIAGATATVPAYAALLLRSPGFEPADLYVAYVGHDWPDGDTARQSRRVSAILEAVDELPGIADAAAVLAFDPVGGHSDGDVFWAGVGLEGRVFPVTSDYFRVMQMSLIAGRSFTQPEVTEGSAIAVLNETAARVLWPERAVGEGVGRSIRTRDGERTVIGIVRDTRQHPGGPFKPGLFLPITASEAGATQSDVPVVIRMEPGRVPDPRLLAALLNSRFPRQTVSVESVTDAMLPWIEAPRLLAIVLGVCGMTAVFLMSVALYALTRFEVTRRAGELRIRGALGATRWQVRRVVLSAAFLPVGCGVVAGLLASLVLASRLEPVVNSSPAVFAGSGLIVLVTALLATWPPTNRIVRPGTADILRGT